MSTTRKVLCPARKLHCLACKMHVQHTKCIVWHTECIVWHANTLPGTQNRFSGTQDACPPRLARKMNCPAVWHAEMHVQHACTQNALSGTQNALSGTQNACLHGMLNVHCPARKLHCLARVPGTQNNDSGMRTNHRQNTIDKRARPGNI